MEESIRKLIQADFAAQEKVKKSIISQDSFQTRLSQEKEKIYNESWQKVKDYVENAKLELDNQIKVSIKENNETYQKSVHELEKKFDEHKDEWRKTIYNRCLD